MKFLCEILVAAMLVKDICIDAAVAGDEIDALPGWDAPLPSKQYSGYLDIPTAHGTGRMHYCPSTLCAAALFFGSSGAVVWHGPRILIPAYAECIFF